MFQKNSKIILAAAAVFFVYIFLPSPSFASVCLPRWSPVGDAAMCLARSQTDTQCITDGMCKWQTCQDAPGANNPPLHCFSKAPDDCKKSPECSLSESKREISIVLQDPNITAKDKAPIENPSGTCLAKLDPENIQYVCNKTSDCVKNPYCDWKPKPKAAPADKSQVAPGNSAEEGIIPSCLFEDTLSNDCKDISIFVKLLINFGRSTFAILGTFALAYFIYGGFILILSQGNAEKIKKGTDVIMAAVIGLFIAFAAYMVIRFLGQAVGIQQQFMLK